MSDNLLLQLLEMDAAHSHRPAGRFIAGEPQAVVELLNAAPDEDSGEDRES